MVYVPVVNVMWSFLDYCLSVHMFIFCVLEYFSVLVLVCFTSFYLCVVLVYPLLLHSMRNNKWMNEWITKYYIPNANPKIKS